MVEQQNQGISRARGVAAKAIAHPVAAPVAEGVGPLLTSREAAEFLRLEPRTLESWRGRPGVGPKFVRYSARCVRYRLKDLQDWVDARVVTGVSA